MLVDLVCACFCFVKSSLKTFPGFFYLLNLNDLLKYMVKTVKVEHDALMAISEKRTHKPQSNLAKRKQKFLKFKLNIIYK